MVTSEKELVEQELRRLSVALLHTFDGKLRRDVALWHTANAILREIDGGFAYAQLFRVDRWQVGARRCHRLELSG